MGSFCTLTDPGIGAEAALEYAEAWVEEDGVVFLRFPEPFVDAGVAAASTGRAETDTVVPELWSSGAAPELTCKFVNVNQCFTIFKIQHDQIAERVDSDNKPLLFYFKQRE